MQWSVEVIQFTVGQLVVGMPGEPPSTIRETCRFAEFANSLAEWQHPWDLSINFAQALPGTPLYEYARRTNIIYPSLDDEEAYLIRVSDRNAADEEATLNFTSYPYFIQRSWQQFIMLKVANAYISKFGKANYTRLLLADTKYFKRTNSDKTGYYNTPKKEVKRVVVSGTIHDVRQIGHTNTGSLPSFWSLIRQRKLHFLLMRYPEICVRITRVLPVVWAMRSVLRREVGCLDTCEVFNC